MSTATLTPTRKVVPKHEVTNRPYISPYFVFSVGPKGICVKNKHNPSTEGQCFLDWCANEESRERWTSAYEKCVTFQVDVVGIKVRVITNAGGSIYAEGHEFDLMTGLEWIGNDRVLVSVVPCFDDTLLSATERSVLDKVAGGLSNESIARILYISESTVRVAISRIKKKLGVKRKEGVLMAASQFGLLGPAEL